ncbi:MAG: Stk1 family PASTA domain-containing Ser/Thr kinase [Bacilli bacterium]|nr:Stk1 family PASTA domain-containing Ser/Thr kinase [Bacilli bacterium]
MIAKGQKINNRYEVIRLLGEGGMANVYLGEDTILNRKVAIKVLRGDLANDEKFLRRFQREALSASSLSHPNIVEMYDVGEDEGNFYIVMEYIEGKNLKQLLRRRGTLTVNEVIDIMLQLTDGIAHAHDSYIIHRDLKPQNILMLDNGMVKITDFGIATALNNSQLTQTNSVMGSVHYLPPEQATGKEASIKSDIYSLGILMYELITGNLPFRGENAVEIALKQMKEKIPSLIVEKPNVPQSVENIVLRACAKNPKNRYNDAREMHEDLKTALNEENKNAQVLKYKYEEEDLGETKILPDLKKQIAENEPIIKEVNNDEEKSGKLSKILIGIISFIVFSIFILIMLLPKLTKIPDVKVPDVRMFTVQKAEKKLKNYGFEVDIETEKVFSDTVKEGMVVKTEPANGRLIKKGSTIKIYESKGTERIAIEFYIGKNIYEIKGQLELKGLIVSIESKEVDNVDEYKDAEDIVIDQSIKDGEVLKGTQIILYYPNIAVYPDMTGWTVNEVEEFVEKYELVLTVNQKETNDYKEGTVFEQSRSKDTLIARKATFSVSIATPIIEEEELPELNEEETDL